ncbi:MAG: adenylate/guanylate cyclase domain-containing protein [Solirubrobacteraceae bacterium]|nr:adenylate/guanylate cyclase domain-containing protein [Solirubrobacteraceae bacterium]
MNDRRQRLRTQTFLVIAVFASLLATGLYASGVMDRLEFDTVDARFDARGAREAPTSVAVVGVDTTTFNDLEQQWPFPRSMHAEVLDRLGKDGARVIAYDVEFLEPTEVEEDEALVDAIERNAPVVLAASETDARGRSLVLGNDELVRSLGARTGHAGFRGDTAEVYRTVPFSRSRLETFAVASAEMATGRQVDPKRFTEPDREAWIDYAGPPKTVLTVPFSQVLEGEFPPGTFKDRIVVVGATAASLQDIHPTSTTARDAQMAGPEIQANAIDTVLRGLPLQSAPGWLEILLVVLLSATMPLLAIMLRFGYAFAAALALGVAYPLAAQFAFQEGLMIPVAVPLLGLAIATVASTAGHALMTAAERQRIRDVFARFVPEAVVDDVLAQTGDDLRLGGQRREGTVLFCDLRGFTSFAERLEPDRVIDVLNVYLSEMSDAIMEREGTIVAFMGDGIMAVFGAPLAREDHADRAVAAAQDMLSVRLPRFNDWLFKQGFEHEFRMGIGLNSGPVMSGNVGSSTRVEYTAIGDTTNTASRIESMTKDEAVQLLVSGATQAALRDVKLQAALREVAERVVRGRDEPIVLWTLNSEG